MPDLAHENGRSHEGDLTLQPVFSIVVPMRNEERYVAETLRSLTGQDYPADRFEILVVDGHSTDSSREIVSRLAAEHPNIRLLNNPRLLASAARNAGIRAARGRFIGIVDCHSFVRPDFLAIAGRLFAQTRAHCLGRPVELFIPTDSYLQRVIGAARTSWLGHNLTSPRYSSTEGATSPISVGILYRREVFQRIGLFDETFAACEDVEFNTRLQEAGIGTWTDPALRTYYHPRGSLWALFKQLCRYGYWRYRLLRVRRGGFHASQAVPAAALVAAGALVLGGVLGVLPWFVPAALAGVYAALIAAASIRAGLKRGLRYLPLLPAAFVAIHAGAAVGLCAGWLEGMRSRVSGWVSGRRRLVGTPTRELRKRT